MKPFILAMCIAFSLVLKGQDNIEIVNNDVETNETNLVEELKEGDALTIDFSSRGCFHSNNEQLKVYFENDAWNLDYTVNQVKKYSSNLSTDDFQKLVDFEKQLREIENSTVFCSTVDDYMFTLNGEEMLKAKDASCSWNGFYKLKRELVNLESKS